MGIFVSGVQAGSPADGQGIQEGDEILQVSGVLAGAAGGGRSGWSPSLLLPVSPPLGPPWELARPSVTLEFIYNIDRLIDLYYLFLAALRLPFSWG